MNEQLTRCHCAALRLVQGLPGRPILDNTEDLLRWFVKFEFSPNDISRVLYVSTRTVQRRAFELAISFRSFSTVTDEQIDLLVADVTHPEAGERMLDEYLRSRVIIVLRRRLRFTNSSL